jgi:small subunit ribosomal protein S19
MAEELQKRSKERYYRGKNVEELKNMDTREFAKLVKSRPRRAILRNYDVIQKFLQKCRIKTEKNKTIKEHNRAIVIVPKMIGLSIGVYNGKEFVKVNVTEEMLGHRLGEFAPTRRPTKHGSAGVGATKSSAAQSKK